MLPTRPRYNADRAWILVNQSAVCLSIMSLGAQLTWQLPGYARSGLVWHHSHSMRSYSIAPLVCFFVVRRGVVVVTICNYCIPVAMLSLLSCASGLLVPAPPAMIFPSSSVSVWPAEAINTPAAGLIFPQAELHPQAAALLLAEAADEPVDAEDDGKFLKKTAFIGVFALSLGHGLLPDLSGKPSSARWGPNTRGYKPK